MERCHYIKDKVTRKRILVPGCMGVAVHYSDKRPLMWCTCGDGKPTIEQRVAALEDEIKSIKRSLQEIKEANKCIR